MAKKLKVELEVDNTEAKKKVKEAVSGAESGAGASAPPAVPTPPATPSADPSSANSRAAKSAKEAADGLEKVNRSARNLSNGAEDSARSLKDVAKSFAGLGVGMSMHFARQFVEQGSTADKALGIGENASNLGFMGAKMAGPWGAAIGGLVGAGKGWMENEKAEADRMMAEAKQRTANIESIQSWQKARAETLAFKATLDQLTDTETSLADRQRMVAEEIKKREEAEEALARKEFREVDNFKDPSALAKAQTERRENAARLDQLRDLQKRLDKEGQQPDGVASHASPDALSRVGGYFANGSAGTDLKDIARTGKEQLSVLKSIESKSGKGATWQ